MNEFWRDYLTRPEILAAAALLVLGLALMLTGCLARLPWKKGYRLIASAQLLIFGSMLVQNGGGFLRDRAEMRRNLAVLQQPAPWLADPEEHRQRALDREFLAATVQHKLDGPARWMMILAGFGMGASLVGLFRPLRSDEPNGDLDPELKAAEDRLRAEGVIR